VVASAGGCAADDAGDCAWALSVCKASKVAIT